MIGKANHSVQTPDLPGHAPKAQHGISLVELMIAVTVGLILLLGVSRIMISGRNAYRIQNASGVLQENARFALKQLNYHLRLADHWGGVEANAVTGAPAIASTPGGICTAAWVRDVATGIQGFDGAADVPAGIAGCIPAADYVANSDVFVVRFADPNGMAADANMIPTRLYVRTAVADRALLQLGGAGAGTIPPAPGTYNFPYNTSVFFIRPCSRQNGAACASTDDGGNPIPTLVRLRLDDGGNFVQEALIEGVEHMQLEYGLDTIPAVGDGSADRWATATNVTADNLWNRVVSVRISIVVRSLDIDPGLQDTTAYPLLAGPNQVDYTAPTNVQVFPRKAYGSVVQLRNRIRG